MILLNNRESIISQVVEYSVHPKVARNFPDDKDLKNPKIRLKKGNEFPVLKMSNILTFPALVL